MRTSNEAIEDLVDDLLSRDWGSPRTDFDVEVFALVNDILASDLIPLPDEANVAAYWLRGDHGQVMFTLTSLIVDDPAIAYTSVATVPVDLSQMVGVSTERVERLSSVVGNTALEVESLITAYERLYGHDATRGAIANDVLSDSCENSTVCPSCQVRWGEEHESFCSFPAWAEMSEEEAES